LRRGFGCDGSGCPRAGGRSRVWAAPLGMSLRPDTCWFAPETIVAVSPFWLGVARRRGHDSRRPCERPTPSRSRPLSRAASAASSPATAPAARLAPGGQPGLLRPRRAQQGGHTDSGPQLAYEGKQIVGIDLHRRRSTRCRLTRRASRIPDRQV
jgi:hypothetical protein